MKTDLLNTLQNHPFLRELPPKYIASLAACAMQTHFDAGQIIFRRNDMANRFYLLLEGEVSLGNFGGETESWIETIGAGEVLGWSWMFEPHLWQFDARANTPVVAIFFYATPLLALCDENAEMGYELMKWSAAVMLSRLQSVRKRLMEAEMKISNNQPNPTNKSRETNIQAAE